MSQIRYRLNQPQVVAENFGDEIIAIHLEYGTYYSIEKSGVAVWLLAMSGATAEEIIANLAIRYQSEPTVIQSAVLRFLAELQQVSLIVPDSTTAGPARPTESPVGTQPPNQRFPEPVLREYTDMQDVLLLDPIHEVTEAGWPNIHHA